MKLPKHLEILRDDYGVMIYGFTGPFHMYIRNKNTGKVTEITIHQPGKEHEGKLIQYFQEEFARAVKEKLNEDIEY